MANTTLFFDPKQKDCIRSIVKKFKETYKGNEKRKILTFPQLYALTSSEEKDFITYFLNLNPRDFGFKGSFFGITDVPEDLVIIKNQKVKSMQASLDDDESEPGIISPQFLPRNVFKDYEVLNEAIKKDLGKSLRIESGYRSPAYQVTIFFTYFEYTFFNTKKVFEQLAFPGYSEHGYSPRQAIDFMTEEGIPTVDNPSEFVKTKEYEWLLKNANKYGFFLSYPENNPDGIMFEPWHWHFSKEVDFK